MQLLATAPIKTYKTGETLSAADNRPRMGPSGQNKFDREYAYTPGTLLATHHAKRSSNRTRANGIVALTNFAKPVVGRIYDIAPGGLSFLHASETDIPASALEMEILIFDNLTKFEFLVNQIKGSIKAKISIADPISKTPTWRYSVEFLDLDLVQQKRLKILFDQVPPFNDQNSYERYQRALYDS